MVIFIGSDHLHGDTAFGSISHERLGSRAAQLGEPLRQLHIRAVVIPTEDHTDDRTLKKQLVARPNQSNLRPFEVP